MGGCERDDGQPSVSLQKAGAFGQKFGRASVFYQRGNDRISQKCAGKLFLLLHLFEPVREIFCQFAGGNLFLRHGLRSDLHAGGYEVAPVARL